MGIYIFNNIGGWNERYPFGTPYVWYQRLRFDEQIFWMKFKLLYESITFKIRNWYTQK